MNLALKTSLVSRGLGIAPHVMRVLCDARSTFANMQSGELMVKLGADVWLVMRKADDREFCVLFDHTKVRFSLFCCVKCDVEC